MRMQLYKVVYMVADQSSERIYLTYICTCSIGELHQSVCIEYPLWWWPLVIDRSWLIGAGVGAKCASGCTRLCIWYRISHQSGYNICRYAHMTLGSGIRASASGVNSDEGRMWYSRQSWLIAAGVSAKCASSYARLGSWRPIHHQIVYISRGALHEVNVHDTCRYTLMNAGLGVRYSR